MLQFLKDLAALVSLIAFIAVVFAYLSVLA